MIDIHCHMISNDESKYLNEALEMAKNAEQEGVKSIINTFNYNSNIEGNTNQAEMIEKLNFMLKENNIDIDVLIGNEVYYNDDLLRKIDNKEFYTLNDSRYILIEFMESYLPKNLRDIVYELVIRGYTPIIAHVEKYHEVEDNISIVKELIREGALIQINASSVLSRNKVCKRLLKSNEVHFIATDCNYLDYDNMKDCYDYICKKYGFDRANKLFIENPQKVINNEVIYFSDESSKRKISIRNICNLNMN